MRTVYMFIVGLLVVVGVLVVWTMNDGGRDGPSGVDELHRIEWSRTVVTTQGGDTLLNIDAFPDTVQVAGDASFGSSTAFTGALLSPDGRWLALTVGGPVHEFGWLYNLDRARKHVVAFQYGGSVNVDSWSPDGHYVVFVNRSPAPTSTLKVVDRRQLSGYPDQLGYAVHIPAEDGLQPPFDYSVEEWRPPHTLCFQLAGKSHCMNMRNKKLEGGS